MKIVGGSAATLRAPEPGPRTFRVRMDTDDYAPEFRKGMDLLIHPDRAKTDGCLVLARIKGQEPFCRAGTALAGITAAIG